uniref:Bm146 n=1 Tax=Brugia malayi TaxID=6279 RepID=A0A0J9XMA6_BRUMA|nr:Bm146 [Brugia malayi]
MSGILTPCYFLVVKDCNISRAIALNAIIQLYGFKTSIKKDLSTNIIRLLIQKDVTVTLLKKEMAVDIRLYPFSWSLLENFLTIVLGLVLVFYFLLGGGMSRVRVNTG